MNYNHITPDVMTKFLTDDLSPEERQAAELHFAVCPECAAKLDEQRRFENDAARSYPRTFSGRLDPDCEKALGEAVREQLNAPAESPVWIKRIRGTVAIQVGAVAAVALLLFAMILAPSGKKRTTDAPEKAGTAALPAQTKEASVKTPPAPVAVPAEKEAPAEEVAAKPSEAEAPVEPPVVTEALNPGLIRLFALNEFSLRPTAKDTFRQGAVCMNSPFESGVCILLAVSPEKEDPAERRAELLIHPEGKTVLLSQVVKAGEEDTVSAALLNAEKKDPDFVFATVFSSDENAEQIRIAGKDVLKDDDPAPAPLRLAAVIHAAGKPRILLNREIRKKMLEELNALVKDEYAGDSRVVLFLEKLRKVK